MVNTSDMEINKLTAEKEILSSKLTELNETQNMLSEELKTIQTNNY